MADDYGYAADRAEQAGHQPVPVVRTHSVRPRPVEIDGEWAWDCRGCGTRWPAETDRESLERQPCGTRKERDDG